MASRGEVGPRVPSVIVWVGACVASLLSGCGGSEDPRPAAWEYISPAILQPSCATSSCHGRAAAVAGLDFSDGDRGYTSLTGLWTWIVDPEGKEEEGCRDMDGVRVCQRLERPLVQPYNPAQSRLVQVLRAHGAPRMPPDRPLSEADIALIERWILDGAHKTLAEEEADDARTLLGPPWGGSSDGTGDPGDGG